MNSFNKVARIHGGAVIYNYDLTALQTEARAYDIPHAVYSARSFKTMKEAVAFLRAQGNYAPAVVKCAYDQTAQNGSDKRRVPQNALYGKFSDGVPFIITDLKIYGRGEGAYFHAIKQVTQTKLYHKVLWDYPDFSSEATLEKPAAVHTLYLKQTPAGRVRTTERQADFIYHAWKVEPIELKEDAWIKFDLPVSCTVGQFAYWYTLLNPPAVIPLRDENNAKNGTIKFDDKRPRTHKDPAPDGNKTGTTITIGKAYKPSSKTQALYSVRYFDKNTGHYVWRTQNESQVSALAREHNTTIASLIKSGEVIAK